MTDLRRLEQVCPRCGRWEAAGPYCTYCLWLTGPDDYYRNGDDKARNQLQNLAGKMPTTPLKRGRGRPRTVSA